MSDTGNKTASLTRYLSPIGVWAISIGTSIGWGSFVITGNTYLSAAGPMGSVLGLIIGAVVMVVIGRNYHYMMQVFPDSGGVYTYSKNAYGFDYGFLTAWFLVLTYISIFWANVTSVPIFFRYFLGNVFRFGHIYNIFGYDIYFGEALLSIIAVLVAGMLCVTSKRMVEFIMVVLALVFSIGITFCFIAAFLGLKGDMSTFSPVFIPDKSSLSQIIRIAYISPWAFIGFENISNSVEEFKFSERKIFSILNVSIISTTLLYTFIILLSITAYPAEYGTWLDYIKDLDRLEGLKGLPAFYAAEHYLGNAGIFILMLALFSIVVTSLIGNMMALSRLIFALARDGVIPEKFAQLNKSGIPGNAVLVIVAVSLLIPFIGRVAIGWIVDVTTLGATIIYGCVSGAAFSIAKKEKEKTGIITGLIGVIVMVSFAVMLLMPNVFSSGSAMAKESYFLFAAWGILGILCFRQILRHDHKSRRFGKSGIVWTVLLMLILLTSQEWMEESASAAAERSMDHIIHHYGLNAEDRNTGKITDEFIISELRDLKKVTTYGTILMVGIFAVSVWIIMDNHSLMAKRELEKEKELGAARTMAYTDPLTGVKSKVAYAETEAAYNTSIRDGTRDAFAVVVCDVNGLKQINDTMGHKAGDELIRAACRIICEAFKHSPVFRIGGDEFVAVLSGQDFDRREEIMSEFNKLVEKNKKNMEVVIAAGMSDFEPGKDKGYHDVFERADAMMYIRKRELKEQDHPS